MTKHSIEKYGPKNVNINMIDEIDTDRLEKSKIITVLKKKRIKSCNRTTHLKGWATIDPPTIDPPTIDPPTIKLL